MILASDDGGAPADAAIDGMRANPGGRRSRARPPQRRRSARAPREANRNVAQGADKPFLDVWFADEKVGFAVGAYNLVFRTDDGGKTWSPWFDRTDNPKFLNLYAIRPAAGTLFVVGENGLVMKLDAAAALSRRRDAVPGHAPRRRRRREHRGDRLRAARQAWRSDDAGRTWSKVDAGLPATIVARNAARQGFALADASGRVSVSRDGGRTFKPVRFPLP